MILARKGNNVKEIKTLHLASFKGNIGDNANHVGAENLFRKHQLPVLDKDRLEIRRFFRKELFFDNDFISKVNKYDLLLIGGGNYFELWPQNTKSGTTIDLDPTDLERIKVPILFYSLGVDTGLGCSEENKQKFYHFLSYCSTNPKIFVSVRNDGALKNINSLFGNMFNDLIVPIPDGGFFSQYSCTEINPFEPKTQKRIGINIAGDMLNTRTKTIGADSYLMEIAKFISKFTSAYKHYKIIFFTHIFKDIQLLSKLFENLPDQILRERIEISHYGQGDNAASTIFGQYNKCDLIIGNRFHSNVVPIGLEIPTIGLANYIQVPNLYEELGLQEMCIDCNDPDFSEKLSFVVDDIFDKYESVKKLYKKVLTDVELDAEKSMLKLRSWFQDSSLV